MMGSTCTYLEWVMEGMIFLAFFMIPAWISLIMMFGGEKALV